MSCQVRKLSTENSNFTHHNYWGHTRWRHHTWWSFSKSCFCCGEGCAMDDMVCSCALTSCRWCCWSAVSPGTTVTCCFTAVPEDTLTAGWNWNCAGSGCGGFGEQEDGGTSGWRVAGWGRTCGWSCTWICWGCCCGGGGAGWGAWGEPPIWFCMMKRGGREEGVHEREGVWAWVWGWGCEGGRDCWCWWGDWIWCPSVRGDTWAGWGLSDRVGVGVGVTTGWDGEALWILIVCGCAADGTLT